MFRVAIADPSFCEHLRVDVVELLGALDTHLLYRAKRNGKLGIAATRIEPGTRRYQKGGLPTVPLLGLPAAEADV